MTNVELKNKVEALEDRLNQVTLSNSALKDDFTQLKTNYMQLVEGLNNRFETFESSFQTFRNARKS